MGKKFKILALSLVTGFSVLALATSTIAWFASGTHVSFGTDPSNVNVFGGSDAAYFESGTGDAADDPETDEVEGPYVISNRIHVYNLAWLQYIGYFNERSNVTAGAEKDLYQCYFVLKNDINMERLTIPPIGTNKYPFLGHFDGQGHKIHNFTVSNDDPGPDGSDFGVAKPANRYGGTQPDVVGFFGVVGKLPNQTLEYTSSIVSISNVTLENFTVVSKTSQVLIGLVGGYVNGDMSGVKVGNQAKIDVNGQVSTAKTNITPNLSDYGLVGYTTRLDNSGNTYIQELSQLYANYDTSNPGGQGQGDDWGGSINLKSLNLRLYNMMNVTTDNGIASDDPSTHHPSKVTASPSTTGNDTISLTGITSGKTVQSQLHKNSSSGSANNAHRYYTDSYNTVSVAETGSMYASANYIDNTPLSRSILYSLEDSGTQTISYNFTYNRRTYTTTFNTELPGTTLPLLVDSKENGYATLSKNTGYIVGGTTTSSGSTTYQARTTIRTASSSIQYIESSINSTTTYDSNKLEVITNSSPTYNSNNFGRISDSYNSENSSIHSRMSSKFATRTIQSTSLKKYNASRDTLDEVLSDASFIHGLHFTGSSVSTSKKETITTAYINGETYSNYEVPKSSIDFNLKDNGYINFFAGSYQNSEMSADSFFSLYTVSRSGSTISNIREISKVYKNIDESTKKNYPHVYLLKDGTTYTTGATNLTSAAAGDLEFDCQFLWNTPPVLGAIYYFEIPVNKGEYAMGSPSSGATKGTYLMYLDIGASGEGKDQVDAHYITTTKSGVAHPIGVDFNVYGAGTSGGDSFGFAIASSNRGTVLVAIATTTNENDAVTVTQSSTIAAYSYRKANYSNSFSITGMSGSPPQGDSEKIRVLTVNLRKAGGTLYNIVITETLGANDVVTETAYSVNDVISTDYDTDAEIEALSGEIDLDEFRDLDVVATLTRTDGTAEFYTEYNISSCNEETIDVTITLNGTTISAAVDSNYTFIVNGDEVEDGDDIS